MRTILAASILIGVVSISAAGAQEAAPTASGLSSEGKQDLSAGTSQSGSPNQPSSNVFSTIKGADVQGRGGTKIGTLADILVDESGAVKQIAIHTGRLSSSKHALDVKQVPFGALSFDVAAEDVDALPALDEKTAAPPWSTASLLGADITGMDNASVADIRFLPEAVDRVMIDTGRSVGSDDVVEVPFTALRLSGTRDNPDVSLSDDGHQRLKVPADAVK
jgi:hypothetical protein